MLFRSFYHTFLQASDCRAQRPVMKIRMCALYSVAPNTIAKPVTKTPRGREQRHVNGYTLGCLQEQAKWPTSAPIGMPLDFCIFAKRLLYENPHVVY